MTEPKIVSLFQDVEGSNIPIDKKKDELKKPNLIVRLLKIFSSLFFLPSTIILFFIALLLFLKILFKQGFSLINVMANIPVIVQKMNPLSRWIKLIQVIFFSILIIYKVII